MSRTSVLGLVFALTLPALTGCRVTGQSPRPGSLGQPSNEAALETLMERPGPLTVEKIHAADWSVPLSGLLNLAHPQARRAGLADRDEPIHIYFHVIRHPQRGTFLVDSGVERGILGDDSLVSGLVGRVMHKERMKVRQDTASWLERTGTRPAGVFLTHLHLDHILGLRDVPAGTPVYVGPGETEGHRFVNAFVQGTTDRALEKHTLTTLPFAAAAKADGLGGVLDVFGDGSLFALHVPGHTEGSLAFVARTAAGPVLLAGDACHTAWGWDNAVEPGSFTEDAPRGVSSFAALRALVARHPATAVHPGHQSLTSGLAQGHR